MIAVAVQNDIHVQLGCAYCCCDMTPLPCSDMWRPLCRESYGLTVLHFSSLSDGLELRRISVGNRAESSGLARSIEADRLRRDLYYTSIIRRTIMICGKGAEKFLGGSLIVRCNGNQLLLPPQTQHKLCTRTYKNWGETQHCKMQHFPLHILNRSKKTCT